MKNEQKHLLARILFGTLLILGLGFWMNSFVVNAASWSLPGGASWNNMTGFLSSDFWDNSPVSGDIITALYGSGDEGSIYTSNWSGYDSGSCLSSGFTVQYLTGGIIDISTAPSNVIVVFASGTYMFTTGLFSTGSCIAFVGSGDVSIYTIGTVDSLFTLSDGNYIIMDNISIEGMSNGSGGNHTADIANTNGIYLVNASNTTLHTIQSHNNLADGIYLKGASNNNISNTHVYNNGDFGILVAESSNNNIINTTQSYNNNYGISLQSTSNNNSINNSQTYNNIYGIYLYNSVSENVVHNTQAYNNGYGLYVYYAGDNILHSFQSYNNDYGIYLGTDSTGTIYYDTNSIFSNINENITGILINLTAGSGSDVSTIGRTTGSLIETGTFSRDLVTNPLNVSGNYLLNWSGTLTGLTGVQTSYLPIITTNYSYGSGILTQVQPVMYSGTTLITGGIFNASKFIGSDVTKVAGDLTIPSYTSITGVLLTGTSSDILVSKYSIFGHIETYKLSQTINTSTGITLVTGLASNTIITQLLYPTSYFATHFQSAIILDTTSPVFTGTTQTSVNVVSGGVYTTGVSIVFSDTNLSGATLNGSSYISGTLITGDTTYIFVVQDLAGNSTGMTFTIDTTRPTLTGVASGAYYNTGKIITGSDNYSFSGFTLNGTFSTGSSLTVTGDGVRIVTGYDTANNASTGITFTIDTTAPVFTGTTAGGANVVSGTYHNTTGITLTYTDTNISGTTLSGLDISYLNTGLVTTITTGGKYLFTVYDLAGNSTGMIFTIDTTRPTLTGVTSGTYYNTSKTITGSDNYTFSGFELSGTFSTGSSLTVTGDGVRRLTGYDAAGNTTGVTFIIDTTSPAFTGTTAGSVNVTSGTYHNTTGITLTFTDTNISGATLSGFNSGNSYLNTGFVSGTTITTGGTYRLTVYDLAGNSTGMTFGIDTVNPSITGNYPTSGLTISGGNTIVFTRSGYDNLAISGYMLYIDSTGYVATGSSYTVILVNGSYTWHVVVYDNANNTGTSSTMPFTLTTPLSGTVTVTGTNVQYIGSNTYTRNYLGLYLAPNQPVDYIITGDITATITGSTLGAVYLYPYLSGSDGLKHIYVSYSNASGEVINTTVNTYFDTVAPAPTLTSPSSGGAATGAFNFTWSIGSDTVGISGYKYFVSTMDTFGTFVTSGSTTSTSVAIANMAFGSTGTFYWYVKAIDKLNNSGSSLVQSFTYSELIDTTPTSFSFTAVTGADIDTVYSSNIVTITGLNTPTLASLNRGALLISGNIAGSTGYVQNGWTVKIELVSSNEYDDSVTSTLTIGGVSATFVVTTEEDPNADYTDIDTDLSSTAQLQIIAIFETLRDLYDGSKQAEFLNSLMIMLQVQITALGTSSANADARDALQYLYDLADQYRTEEGIGTGSVSASRIVNGVYTAPNGKKYTITYNADKGFTSTNFVTPKYFPTLDVLKYTIDINNAAGTLYINGKAILARWGRIALDGTRQTSPYTAPNHKVFYFFKTMDGEYSSYTFTTEKYFDSLELVKEHIYTNNR